MLAGGAVATAVAQAAGLAALGLASILLGRALSPAGYGAFAVALGIQALALGVATVGLGQGVAFEIAAGRCSPSSALRRAVIASMPLGAAGAAVTALALAAAGDSLLPGVSTAAIVALLAGIQMGVVLLVLVGAAVALERYEAAALMLAAQPIGIAILSSAVAIPFGVSATVAAIGAALFVTGSGSVVWALHAAATVDLAHPQATGSLRVRDAVRFGSKTWASDLLMLLNLRVDLVLVGAIVGSAEAGVYAVGATIVSVGLVAPQALALVLLPGVARSARNTAGHTATATIGQAGRQSAVIATVTALGLIPVVLLIPTVYGSAFADSVALGMILVPGIAAYGVSRIFAYALAGLGAPDTLLRLTALVGLPTLAAYPVVIPPWGATGAAVVSTVSYVVTMLVLAVALKRRSGISGADMFLPRRSDLALYRGLIGALTTYARGLRAASPR